MVGGYFGRGCPPRQAARILVRGASRRGDADGSGSGRRRSSLQPRSRLRPEKRKATRAMASIVLDRVTKLFASGIPALADVSLEIADGEQVVVVGPSGCGKSTLLRLIAGLEELTSGTIAVGGKDITHLAPKDRNVAMVFQDYALY